MHTKIVKKKKCKIIQHKKLRKNKEEKEMLRMKMLMKLKWR